MIHFLLAVGRQGKVRVAKWYSSYTLKEKAKLTRDVTNVVFERANKACNFVEYKGMKIIYRRYASLYFIVGVDSDDNELLTLQTIHFYVEVLDRYFGNVCELDLVFNFHKAFFTLDEVLLAGLQQESNKKLVANLVMQQDQMSETYESGLLGLGD